ncbi:hypothetical protein GA0061084_0023 [Arthrobacter sp. NIO-1057]|nr:hypothetical protein GA0061084_0023 [Arthrobacter sp. NIO-1057]
MWDINGAANGRRSGTTGRMKWGSRTELIRINTGQKGFEPGNYPVIRPAIVLQLFYCNTVSRQQGNLPLPRHR